MLTCFKTNMMLHLINFECCCYIIIKVNSTSCEISTRGSYKQLGNYVTKSNLETHYLICKYQHKDSSIYNNLHIRENTISKY